VQLRSLEKRERWALFVCGVVVLATVLYLVVEGPLEKYTISKGQLIAARQNLARARAMHGEIQEARQDREAVQKVIGARGSGYNLLTAVSRAVQIAQLTDRAVLDSLPRELVDASAVKITLRGVSMQELVDLFHDVHSKDSLVVLHRVSHLRPALDGKGLDCEVILITPRV